MKRFVLVAVALLLAASSAMGQAKKDVKYPRGFIMPSKDVLKARHDAARKRHDDRMAGLPKATAPSFDLRQSGCVPPIKDQGNCGSCWVFGGTDTCEIAFMRAGSMSVTSGGLAEQYWMDCGGGNACNGGDEYDVIVACKAKGLPSTADYGTYQQRSNRCSLKAGTKMWQIVDFGFCTAGQEQGVASVQDIKNAMMAYGPISVAVDAGAFDSYTGGVLSGVGHNIDHAVMLIGWDDSKGRNGAWLLRNQWSTQWGIVGYMWIEYGAYDVGTEAIWVSVTQLPPPPPPTPVPPTPVPPAPTPTPMPGDISLTLKSDGTYIVTGGVLVRPDMTLKQIVDAYSKPGAVPTTAPVTKCDSAATQKRIDDLEKVIKVQSDAIIQLQQLLKGKQQSRSTDREARDGWVALAATPELRAWRTREWDRMYPQYASVP